MDPQTGGQPQTRGREGDGAAGGSARRERDGAAGGSARREGDGAAGGSALQESEPSAGADEESVAVPEEYRAQRSVTVLLVEDQAPLRDLVSTILAKEGHAVVPAADGEEALLLTARMPRAPDVLVTDVAMPRLAGTALAERLRERWPNLCVVFVSGYAAGDQDWADAVPGAIVLGKPFGLTDLLQAIDKALTQSGGA